MRQQRPSQRIGHFNMKKETNQQSHHIQKKKVVHLSRMSKTRSRKKKREKSGWKMHIKKYLAYWLTQIQTTLTCVCVLHLCRQGNFLRGHRMDPSRKYKKEKINHRLHLAINVSRVPKKKQKKLHTKLKDFLSTSGDRPKTNPRIAAILTTLPSPPPYARKPDVLSHLTG